jgi:hypothetical protein
MTAHCRVAPAAGHRSRTRLSGHRRPGTATARRQPPDRFLPPQRRCSLRPMDTDPRAWARPGSASLAAFAAVTMALALAVSSGMLDPWALALVSLAGVSAFAAARMGLRGEPGGGRRAVVALLSAGLAASVAHNAVFLPGATVDPARLGAFRPALVVAGVAVAALFWRSTSAWLARARFGALVVAATVLGAAVIRASPAPGIDVWHCQQLGALALLDGRNPYTVAYPNIYGPGTPFIDPSLLSPDGRLLLANPYPPLLLLLDAPAALVGDARWAMLAAVAASALLVRRLGRGSIESELAAALLLLQPQAFLVLELAWTEPVALAGLLAAALAVARVRQSAGEDRAASVREWLLPGLAGAFAASTKQYAALLLVPLLLALPSRLRPRAFSVAAGGTLAVAVPFLLWDPRAFVRGVVEFQIRQPFRTDALSWPAAVVSAGGPRLPSWPAFIVAAAVLFLTLRRTVTPAQAVLSAATTWIAFVAFNKQAFCNYYWLAVGLLCAAVALLSAEARTAPSQRPRRSSG